MFCVLCPCDKHKKKVFLKIHLIGSSKSFNCFLHCKSYGSHIDNFNFYTLSNKFINLLRELVLSYANSSKTENFFKYKNISLCLF